MNPSRHAHSFMKTHLNSATAIIWLATPFVGALTLIGFTFDAPLWTAISTVSLEVLLFIWGFRARPHGLLFSFFVVSTFTFLTGRIFVVGVLGYKSTWNSPWGLHLNEAATVNWTLAIQQCFLFVCWFAVQAFTSRHARLDGGLHRPSHDKIGVQIGIASMIVGFLAYVQNRIGVVGAIRSTSYQEYYLTQDTLVSPTGRIGDSLLLFGFAFVLASVPRFRMFVFASGIILLAHGLDLLMGRRVDFVLSLLLVVFYAFLRASLPASSNEQARNWPTVRKLFVASLLLIPLIPILNIINNVRFAQSASSGEDTSPLLEFFYSQGVSANILAYLNDGRLALPADKFYSFGPLIEFVQTRLMPGFDSSLYESQSAERAMNGHQLADAFSYLIMPTLYEQGAGYGSSAIAELYIDFSWFGVIAGAAILGYLMSYGGQVLSLPAPIAAVVLVIAREMLFVPRAPFLQWLVGALNVYNILALLLISSTLWAFRSIGQKRLQAVQQHKFAISNRPGI